MKIVKPALGGVIIPVSDLDAATRADMWKLMTRYFQQASRALFERDLADKQWVILLRDGEGRVRGFSTLAIMTARRDGRSVHAVYTGDTIADRACWGTLELPKTFLRFVARHTGVDRDGADWYWFYVCKGYRTYRFLPVFYHRFYPHPELTTPDPELMLLNTLARQRFGEFYDVARGVVRVPDDYALRPGVGDVTPGRIRDPFIGFFARRNPGWPQGDELVCMAPLRLENLLERPRRWLARELAT